MKFETVAVRHPDDPSVRKVVRADRAHLYEPWEEPKAQQAPAAEGGDRESAEAPKRRPRRTRKGG